MKDFVITVFIRCLEFFFTPLAYVIYIFFWRPHERKIILGKDQE